MKQAELEHTNQAYKFCFKCGNKLNEEVDICPKCGVRQPTTNNSKDHKKPSNFNQYGILDLVIAIIGVFISLTGLGMQDLTVFFLGIIIFPPSRKIVLSKIPKTKRKYANIVFAIVFFFLLLALINRTQSSNTINTTQINPNNTTLPVNPQIQKEREEKRQEELATKYCDNRQNNNRYFSIPTIISKGNGRSVEFDEATIRGNSLTLEDCRKIINSLEEWGVEDINKLIEGKYWIGMSKLDLITSLGIPNDVNTSNYGSGPEEQLIYYKDQYGISSVYFYIKESKVTTYQDF